MVAINPPPLENFEKGGGAIKPSPLENVQGVGRVVIKLSLPHVSGRGGKNGVSGVLGFSFACGRRPHAKLNRRTERTVRR